MTLMTGLNLEAGRAGCGAWFGTAAEDEGRAVFGLNMEVGYPDGGAKADGDVDLAIEGWKRAEAPKIGTG